YANGVNETNVTSLSGCCPDTTGTLIVTTGPPAALSGLLPGGSGGWRIGSTGPYHTNAVDYQSVQGQFTVNLEFKCIPGFGLPPKPPNGIAFGNTGGEIRPVTFYYLTSPPLPQLGMTRQSPNFKLWLSNGLPNYTYALDYRAGLGRQDVWQPLLTNRPL